MSLKAKIMSAIIALVLSISTLIVGVVALKNANFNVQGSINFTAKGVNALVSYVGLENCTFIDGTVAPTPIDFSTKHEVANLAAAKTSWTGLKLQFNETTTFPYKAKLNLSIKNNGVAGECLLANIETASENVKVSPNNITVEPGATQNYSITFTLNSNVDTMIGFDLTFNLSLSDVAIEPLVKFDSENNYHYLTLGNYNETPIRWRYVGYRDGETLKYSRTPIDGQTAVFVQETYTVSKQFNTLKEGEYGEASPDYQDSDVRAYLTGTQFASDYNMTGNELLNKIIARSLSDLYSEINWDSNTGSISGETGKSTDLTDKFWLMSIKEAYNLLGNNSATDNVSPSTGWGTLYQNQLIWNPLDVESYGEEYWLRSPNDFNVYYINGGSPDSNVADGSRYIRPAFLLEI